MGSSAAAVVSRCSAIAFSNASWASRSVLNPLLVIWRRLPFSSLPMSNTYAQCARPLVLGRLTTVPLIFFGSVVGCPWLASEAYIRGARILPRNVGRALGLPQRELLAFEPSEREPTSRR